MLTTDNTSTDIKTGTPINELSLEDELSAMTQRPHADSSDSMDDFVSADVSEDKVIDELHNISDIAKQDAINSFDSSNITITPSDMSSGDGGTIPDIVAISSTPRIGKEPSPDFVTSTPKKQSNDDEDDDEDDDDKEKISVDHSDVKVGSLVLIMY